MNLSWHCRKISKYEQYLHIIVYFYFVASENGTIFEDLSSQVRILLCCFT
jgi:hypothetical protein